MVQSWGRPFKTHYTRVILRVRIQLLSPPPPPYATHAIADIPCSYAGESVGTTGIAREGKN